MTIDGFPRLLRSWRTARRLSQEQLAADAQVSTRHLSFLETGKAQPSRSMVLVLGSALELELRERNLLLNSAGFAPVYASSALDSLALAPVRRALELVLAQQEPFSAVVIDRCWNVLQANGGAARLLGAFLPTGVEPQVAGNLARLALHPGGLRPFIVNWPEIAEASVERLAREVTAFPLDEERRSLLDEVRGYDGVGALGRLGPGAGLPAATIHLRRGPHEVRLFMLLTTIGTPLDVTAQELSIETYFPVDEATERWFRQ